MSIDRTLTFVQEEIDIETLRRLRPDALLGQLVCFDPALHYFLMREGIEHHTISDFVTENDREPLYDLFDRLWKTWKGFLVPPIEHCGINPFALAPARHLCCLRRVAYSVLAIRRALCELKPERLVGFAEHNVHGLEQVAGANRRMPLVQGMVQFEAEQRGIAHTALDRRDVPGYVPWADLKAASAKAAPPVQRRPFRRAMGKPLVIAAGNGRELIQQRPVVEELRRRGEVQVLHLGLVLDPRTREELHQYGHVFHELADVDVPLPPLPTEAIRQEAATRRQAAQAAASGDVRVFFDNPFIQSHFDFLLGTYLERMLVQIVRWTTLLEQWRPDLVLVNWDLPIAGIARARGIPVLAMLHSMMSPVDPVYHHWAHSHLAVLSEGQAQRAAAAGTPPQNVRATGHPDSDMLFTVAEESPSERNAHRAEICRRLNIEPHRRIILLLSNYIESITSSVAWFPNVNMRRAIRSWGEIAAMADRHPEWQFVVKGHPRSDHLHVYREILANTAHNNAVVSEGLTLADIAPASDAAVLCNTTTSAQLETCFWKLPIVLLDNARCWLNPHARDEFAGWPRVDSVGQLEQWLARTGTDRDVRRREQAATLAACDAFTGPRDGRAAQRVADFVQYIAASGSSALAVQTQGHA